MNLPGLSIRRPVSVIILLAVVIVLGVISLDRTPLDLMPELELPIAAVITTYEGAGPYEIENSITRPIESAIATLDGLQGITSTSERGQSMIVAEFAMGSNMDFVALDMREALDLVRPLLPSDADDPILVKFSPASLPILAITLGGDRSPEDLRSMADDIILPRLERIDGVASVGVSGGLEREIHIDVHPGRMQTQQVALEQIAGVLQGDNITSPGGTVQFQQREFTLRTTGEFTSLEEIADLQIPTNTGVMIPLRHIAAVSEGYKKVLVHTRLNFTPAVGLSIQKESGANTVQVARRVHQELERLQNELGSDIELSVVLDQAEMIEESINSVASNGLVGALLASAILWVFLRNFQALAAVAIAIPVSIIATFVLIYFSGMSLNIISLGGLALGVGMLVDNTIVVLENIVRHRQEGAPVLEAAEKGSNEVASAIIASTLTTVSVFLPVIFVQGIARQLFQDMSLTVSFSLLASLVVALSLVPLMASRWLRGKGGGPSADAGQSSDGIAPTLGWTVRLQNGYARVLRWALRRRRLVLAVVFIAFVASMAMLPMVGAEFIPEVDQGFINVSIELPVGSTIEDTERVVSQLEEAIYAFDETESVYARVGGGAQFGMDGSTSERATIDVSLIPLRERSRSSFEVAEEIRQISAGIAGATISVSTADALMGAFAGAPIQIQVRGDDEAAMERLLADMAAAMEQIPGIREVSTSLDEQRPEYRLEVRRERARELALSVPQIASTVRTAVEGQVVTRYRTGGEEIDVRLRLQGDASENLEALTYVPIWSPVAGMVPLSEVIRFVPSSVPSSLQRQDQSRIVTVSADVFGRNLGFVMADVAAVIEQLDVPAHLEVRFGGDVQEMQEAFGDLGIALLLAVFLVYAVMAVQFESFRHPLTIMFSVPMAGIGVVVGLVVTQTPLSVPGFIGLIMLAGIVVNNAIVLVDYVNILRSRGVEKEEALVQAGRTRLRPVLMMTLTTVLGMVPLALGIGEGAEVQAPMAIVVVFGLAFSTILTLVVVPLMYLWVDGIGQGRIARFFGRLFSRRSTRRAPAASQ